MIKPLNDRILVRPDPPLETSKGGIIIPEKAMEAITHGEVVASGDGFQTSEGLLVPMRLVIGDKVYYTKYSGTAITVNEEELLIMREMDVLAKD